MYKHHPRIKREISIFLKRAPHSKLLKIHRILKDIWIGKIPIPKKIYSFLLKKHKKQLKLITKMIQTKFTTKKALLRDLLNISVVLPLMVKSHIFKNGE